MLTAILAAAFGLIGVIAGALTTGGAQAWLARQDRERQARAHLMLLFVGLSDAASDLERMGKPSYEIKVEDWGEVVATWDECRLPVAMALDTPAVMKINHAVRRLVGLEVICAEWAKIDASVTDPKIRANALRKQRRLFKKTHLLVDEATHLAGMAALSKKPLGSVQTIKPSGQSSP